MVLLDYKAARILARGLKTGAFDENQLKSCHVIGVVAEAALKLAYRPEVGALPCPVSMQSEPRWHHNSINNRSFT